MEMKMKVNCLGATYLGNNVCEFKVWAPLLNDVALKILAPGSPSLIPMKKDARGYWEIIVEGTPGMRYLYCLDGVKERPDPASHFQPEGVHKPSQVVDHDSFRWEDTGWQGIPLPEMIMYEIHVGTFTPEGTLETIIPRLDVLKDLGINAIEIMPIAQFPGERNWGYDGTYPFAVHNSYGGPKGLKKLVNACHQKQIAVILDVVYNHLGPEGNYLWDFGPYFTNKYKSPWGDAVNLDGTYSDEVKNFFIESAVHWLLHYHIDGLRLDAVHAIVDTSAKHFLCELAERIDKFSRWAGRKIYLIAESDLNDTRLIKPPAQGGYGLDAQWHDDLHHALHVLLTGEKNGYYQDFGQRTHLVKAFQDGFVYDGEYSEYRKRRHGNSSKDRPAHQFVVCSQNHDQIGNRMFGERLSQIVSLESLKLAASVILLSPYIPLLFMGEEYGEKSPFLYFVSHSDPGLIEAVRKGRKEEFASFHGKGEAPDPQADETFLKSRITWENREREGHKSLWNFYRYLLALRKEIPALAHLSKDTLDAGESEEIIWMRRWRKESEVFCLFNFHDTDRQLTCPMPEGKWAKVFDSAERTWNGPGTILPQEIVFPIAISLRPWSVAVYRKTGILLKANSRICETTNEPTMFR